MSQKIMCLSSKATKYQNMSSEESREQPLNPALLAAVQSGDVDKARKLLIYGKCDANCADEVGQTIILVIYMGICMDLVRMLVFQSSRPTPMHGTLG